MKKVTILINDADYKQYGLESDKIDFFTFKNLVLEKNNQEIHKLSLEQKNAIIESRETVKKGKIKTNKEIFSSVNKWLGK